MTFLYWNEGEPRGPWHDTQTGQTRAMLACKPTGRTRMKHIGPGPGYGIRRVSQSEYKITLGEP